MAPPHTCTRMILVPDRGTSPLRCSDNRRRQVSHAWDTENAAERKIPKTLEKKVYGVTLPWWQLIELHLVPRNSLLVRVLPWKPDAIKWFIGCSCHGPTF